MREWIVGNVEFLDRERCLKNSGNGKQRDELAKILGVIPSRYASTRLASKPLLDICGKPMVRHVYRRAVASGFRGRDRD